MQKKLKVCLAILFSFVFCFVSLGYAAVTGSLTVTGRMTHTAQTRVFICDVEPTDTAAVTVKDYFGTALTSTVDLSKTGNNTATLNITLYNNSTFVYVFDRVDYLLGEGTYDNQNITLALNGLQKGQELAGGQYLEFSATFSYLNGQPVANTVLNSIINFNFIPASEYVPEIAVSDALGQFEVILNTEEDFNALITQMENNNDRANDTYIGNVVGASTADTRLLEQLFTEEGKNYLVLDINGKKTSVTAMIKRENLDGNTATGESSSGNEMTIYLTADNISSAGWRGSVTVYAIVFTKPADSDKWVQIGNMYEGTATVNNYNGSLFGTRNSFNTDTWSSSNIYHGVASKSNIEAVIAAYLREK